MNEPMPCECGCGKMTPFRYYLGHAPMTPPVERVKRRSSSRGQSATPEEMEAVRARMLARKRAAGGRWVSGLANRRADEIAKKVARADEMYRDYLTLGTLDAVGEKWGVTRERVRQLLDWAGHDFRFPSAPRSEMRVPCACGCGEMVKRTWAVGHHKRKRRRLVPCACGCGQMVKRTWVRGHYQRGRA